MSVIALSFDRYYITTWRYRCEWVVVGGWCEWVVVGRLV